MTPESEADQITWQLKKLREVEKTARNLFPLRNKIKNLEKRLQHLEYEKHLAR